MNESGKKDPSPNRLRLLGAQQNLTKAIGIVIWSLLGAGILAGIWHVLRFTFGLWGVDADSADLVLLWHGVEGHGIQFLQQWRFTPDNWLFSLIPFDALVFSIWGAHPFFIILLGALFFLAIVGLSGLLVVRARGPLAAGLMVLVMLFASRVALGADGFLSYSISHGVTLAWGLFGLWLLNGWITRLRWGFLLGAGVCLFVASISDPWANAAFLAPIAGACLVMLALSWRGWLAADRVNRTMGSVLAVDVAASVIASSKVFGLFWFLPSAPLNFASWAGIMRNGYYALHYLPVFVNVVPGALVHKGAMAHWIIVLITLILVMGLLFVGTVQLVAMRQYETLSSQFTAWTALLSILIIAAALVLRQQNLAMVTARYFSNLYVFFPIFVVLTLFKPGRGARIVKSVAVLMGIGGVVVGISSANPTWSTNRLRVSMNGIPQLVGFLQAHQLQFGFGPYWGDDANAVGWLSNYNVRIYPLGFDHARKKFADDHPQSAPLWYTPAHLRHEPRRVFLILPSGVDYCAPFANCLAAADDEFGAPEQVLQHQGTTILVYNHRIFP
jgi:hypothetical protein